MLPFLLVKSKQKVRNFKNQNLPPSDRREKILEPFLYYSRTPVREFIIGNNENMNENEISKEREEVSESDLSMRKREGTDANGTEASCADEGNMKGTDCERESTVVKKKTSWADIVKKRGEIKSDEQNIKGS